MPTLDGYTFAYPPSVIFRAEGLWLYGREPILRRMPDGGLVCLIYSGGPREPDNANVVLITRSADDGATWTTPEVLFSHPQRGAWSTELFTEGDQPCAFVHLLNADCHYLELQTYRSTTADSGRTWSAPAMLPGGLSGVIVRQGLVLHDGTWLFPVYWQEALQGWGWGGTPTLDAGPRSFFSGALRSEDGGRTFTLHGNLRADTLLWEPNVVEVAPNQLVMLLRSDGTGVKFRADSTDGGRTWSAPYATDIPDAGSKITLLCWEDTVLMLHNPSDQPGWEHRHTLALWISRDGCRTWERKIDLMRADPPDGRVACYPHAFLNRDSLYVACDAVQAHYLLRVPLADLR